MSSAHLPKNPRKGSTLIAVVVVVVVLSLVLASVLRFSSNTQKNSVRQTRMEKAKLIAESEMEYLFFRWIAEVNRGTSSNTVATRMNSDGHTVASIDTDMVPFSDEIESDGWRISRSIAFYTIPETTDGSAIGLKPGTTKKTGRNYYFVARTRASRTDPTFGLIEYRAGRRFVRSETSLLQFAVFYQDDLELAPGSDMTILGPVSTNGNAYIGAQLGANLYITDQLNYAGMLNGDADESDAVIGTTFRAPGASGSTELHDPTFDTDLNDGNVPDQVIARAEQVEKLNAPENFVGGVNVQKALADYPDVYADENDVMRSIIAPPPKNGDGSLKPEDPTVENRRMYNRAGLVVTVSVVAGAPVVNFGTSTNPTAYNADVSPALRNEIIPEKRAPVFDKRENKFVNVTTMDVERLNYALLNTPTLNAAYNGVLYVHDDTSNVGEVNVIRLKNGAVTPDIKDANGLAKGFAVVSDNGIYVQGDYNTKEIIENGVRRENPAAIMGDAVTILSREWNDANSVGDISLRPAGQRGTTVRSTTTPADYTADADYTGTENTLTLNAAILTGNTPSGTGTNSGGVQNLVRMMEDWSGKDVLIKGSLGQLFRSKYMNANYLGTNEPINGDLVYWVPNERFLKFDEKLAKSPPAWTPTTTEFHRGDLFTW